MGEGGAIRKDGKVIKVPSAYKTKHINFGPFEAESVTIPWGDVSTAYFSTGIANIEVYLGANEKMINQMKKLNPLFVISISKRRLINVCACIESAH